MPDEAKFNAALAAAHRADDAMLVSAALDALGAAQVMGGHLAKTHELGAQRLSLLARLPAHQPRTGSEIHDILHMAVKNAISADAVSFALETALRSADDGSWPPRRRWSRANR